MAVWYRTGTVSVTNGSATVTGTGTLWLTQGIKVGDVFTVDGANWYEISAVNSDTSLTLQRTYAQSTNAVASYAIIRNFANSSAADIATMLAALVSKYNTTLDDLVAWLSQTGDVTLHDAAGNALVMPSVNKILAAFRGSLTLSPTSATTSVTLTASQAENLFVTVSGTRTANLDIVVPTTLHLYSVINSTTGAYTVTVKTPGAGTGVVVPQGKRMLLMADGVNVTAADGMGTMGVQNANAVAITGGTITGITDLLLADGGTGASDAAGARTNLGVPAAASPSTSGTLTHSGDIVLSGSGKRITGDFTNAIVANRILFQSSTTNGATQVGALPNGSGTLGEWAAYGGSDTANAIAARLAAVGTTEVRLTSDKAGTPGYAPLTFFTGGAERVRIDTSGNVGIGGASAGDRLLLQQTTGNSAVVRFYQAGVYEGWAGVKASVSGLSIGSGSGTSTEQFRFDGNGNALVVGATGGLGYGTGAGGTVTQATSKSTAVTLNKPSGRITTAADALASGATAVFVLNNSTVAQSDTVSLSLSSAAAIADMRNYQMWAMAAAGLAYVAIRNISGGSLSEAVAINFAVIKGATS